MTDAEYIERVRAVAVPIYEAQRDCAAAFATGDMAHFEEVLGHALTVFAQASVEIERIEGGQ